MLKREAAPICTFTGRENLALRGSKGAYALLRRRMRMRS